MKAKITIQPRYVTTDNRAFESRVAALEHEFRIDMRAVVREARNGGDGKPMSSDDVAEILCNKGEKVIDLMKYYRKAIAASLNHRGGRRKKIVTAN